MKKKSITKLCIYTECHACGGTGLYSGFMEGPGQAVQCGCCDATGCEVLSGQPFMGRTKRRGIKKVFLDRGTANERLVSFKKWWESTK
jgi:hypothetical protein